MNAMIDSPREAFFTSLRRVWSKRMHFRSETRFAIVMSLIWATLYNLAFWNRTLEAMWRPSFAGIGFLVSLWLLVLSLQTMLLLLMPNRTFLRAATSVLFIIAAAGAYFCNEYGAIMNKDMLRNVLETDTAEVAGLLDSDIAISMLVLGLFPAVLVWRVSFPPISWSRRLRQRLKAFAAIVATCTIALLTSSANYAVFFREYKPIRFTLMPIAPVSSLVAVLGGAGESHSREPLLNPAGESHRAGPTHARPLVLFVVIGETARAANFQLGGYARETNPALKQLDKLVYFDQTLSCATSTALSVPCMFSSFGREQFEADSAGRYANLLDALVEAGLAVEWRENNAGCKGVCGRITQVTHKHKDAALCPHSYCYDDVMLTDLPARLEQIAGDTVIVFHQIGSHGPAYAERYPPEFERFKPACRTKQLHDCTEQEVVNAYDNTIAYTDHVLARQIGMLSELSDRIDGALIYVSDHGESLGEQGIYLHGMPYSFAPDVQKHVPMLLWTSSQYDQRVGLRSQCVRDRAHVALSHDNLYHTILGLTEVRNQAYESRLDILSGCRAGALGFDHE